MFFAMFCGKMAETKENIDLPDCEYEGMLELLRYIYTDEVCLTESNVMQVAYLGSIVVYRLTNYVIFVNRSPNVVVSFVGRII